MLFSFIYQDSNDCETRRILPGRILPNVPLDLQISSQACNDTKAYQGEAQHLFSGERLKTITGFGYVDMESETNGFLETSFGPIVLDTIPLDSVDQPRYINGYVYMPIELTSSATIILGASYDDIDGFRLNSDWLNPKFGLIWLLTPSTTLRFAAFRVVKRSFVASQTIEPTQIAGFNQFFDDTNGSQSARIGIGLDQYFTRNLFAGFEFSWRDLDLQRIKIEERISIEEDHDEEFHRAYIYWAPISTLALSVEYLFEGFDRNPSQPISDLDELRTHYVPLSLGYYHPGGFFSNLGATFVHQEIEFEFGQTDNQGKGDELENFWVVDAAIGYRLPKRYGLVSVEIKNLFNEDFQFQSSFDPDL
jgi:outer membrane receptor protein involved in Fe transport